MTSLEHLSIKEKIFNYYKENNYFEELNKLTFKKKIKVGIIDYNCKNGHGADTLNLVQILQTFYNFDIIYIDLEKEKTFSRCVEILIENKVDIIVNTITSQEEERIIIPEKIIFISSLDNLSPQKYCFPNNLKNVFVIQSLSQDSVSDTYKTLGYLNDTYNGNSTAATLALFYFIIVMNKIHSNKKIINYKNVKKEINEILKF